MNGLEAIKVMMEGKLVSKFNPCMEDEIYKIIDGNVCVKFEDEPDEKYEVSEDFDFDTTYHEYIEPKPLTGWERASNKHDEYFCIGHCGDIRPYSDDFLGYDRTIYKTANYFSTKEKAEEINFKQTLFRKLQRFSDENGGNEIDWNGNKRQYYISYNYFRDGFAVSSIGYLRDFGQVYFVSRAVAEKAIDLFHDDLIKYFTMHD